MSYHIAVIDVGKTNKKIFVFDQNLRMADSAYRNFEEYTEGNVHFENIGPMVEWFKEQLSVFAKKYPIKALSITTHGATAMCIDRQGELAVPPVAYTTEAGEQFRKEFFDTFGSPVDLQKSTSTAEIGSLINVGKKIFFLQKRYPEQFKNVAQILNYPQYLGYVFTGNSGAEPTYVGCHTYLYDFQKNTYSHVADKLGIRDKLPPRISKSWDILGTIRPSIAAQTGLDKSCIVTMGIHDSNSSLLPYLVRGHDNFVLNSTGTWCVAMHPTDSVRFEAEELGKLVFYNLDAFFNPVKTSIFMGGLEFDTYVGIVQKICNRNDYPRHNPAVYQRVVSDRRLFILPSVVKGTGLFPDAVPKVVENGTIMPLADIERGAAVPAFFRDYETAFAVLNLSLALQTTTALHMAGYRGHGSIFTEGGFRRNENYNALLADMHPDSKASLTKLEEATAFGAAILGKAALDKTTPMETRGLFEIESVAVRGSGITGLEEYEIQFDHFMQL